MTERIKRELALLRSTYGEIRVDPELGWFIVVQWPLPPGWNKKRTSVLILIPPGYAVTPPDNFYTEPDLALANGTAPGNAPSAVDLAGQRWLQFSYHIEAADWQPENGHNLLTYLGGVSRRLQEAS